MADKRLLVFYTVGRFASFTRAAESLNMTQPAVTFQIRQLEEELSIQLLRRDHKKVALTEAGVRVLSYAERILQMYSEMEMAVRGLRDKAEGCLQLIVQHEIMSAGLMSVLQAFHAQVPGCQLQIQSASLKDCFNELNRSCADAIFILHECSFEEANEKSFGRPVLKTKIPWALAYCSSKDDCSPDITADFLQNEAFWVLPSHNLSISTYITKWLKDLHLNDKHIKSLLALDSLDCIPAAIQQYQRNRESFALTMLPMWLIDQHPHLRKVPGSPIFYSHLSVLMKESVFHHQSQQAFSHYISSVHWPMALQEDEEEPTWVNPETEKLL